MVLSGCVRVYDVGIYHVYHVIADGSVVAVYFCGVFNFLSKRPSQFGKAVGLKKIGFGERWHWRGPGLCFRFHPEQVAIVPFR